MIFIVAYMVLFSNRAKTKERMKMISETGDTLIEDIDIASERLEAKEKIKRVKKPALMSKYLEKKRKKLAQAYILMKPEEFMLLSLIFALIGFILLYVLTNIAMLGIVGGVIGFMLPDAYIGSIKKKRGLKLNNQLPEGLNIIANGLRAGLSFSQAVSIAGKDLESPISDEFTKVIRDNTLGKTMEDSLMDFSKRTDDEDVDMFVTAMIIQRQVGGNLSEVLDTISNTIRERVRLKGQVSTLTAQSKLSAIVICLLPIGLALIMSLINPGYISKLFTEPLGLVMLGGAGFLMLIGIFILTRLVKIDV